MLSPPTGHEHHFSPSPGEGSPQRELPSRDAAQQTGGQAQAFVKLTGANARASVSAVTIEKTGKILKIAACIGVTSFPLRCDDGRAGAQRASHGALTPG